MFRTAQSLMFFILFAIGYLLLASTPIFAQTQEPNPSAGGLHNYTQNVMIEVMSALNCQLAGIDFVDPAQKCLGVNNGKIGPVDSSGGAIGAMGNLIAVTFTPSAHTGDFVNYLAGNFGITKPVYAQGIGFQSLNPLTNVWIAFRNMTYLLFVLIFVAIGFAIMLRVRIDPRTVMTIENQIPKIIIGLILVTFSFAIAGFLIDLMWVSTYLAINVFNNIDVPGMKGTILPAFSDIQGRTPFEVANNIALVNTSPSGIFGIVTNATNAVREVATNLFSGENTPLNILSEAPLGVGPLLGFIGNAVISLLVFIVIGIAVLFALFRLWFQLIKAYVMILIVIVFSPFWILAGLLPGSRLTFGNLLRELGSNLIAFPATIVMFLLGKTFIEIFAVSSTGSIFVPPLIGNPGGDYRIIGAIAGLGIILLTPDVVKMMRKALQAPEFDFSAIAAAIGAGAGVPGRLVGGAVSTAFAPHYRTPPGGGPPTLVYPGGGFGRFLRGFGIIR